ncbi:hypothetical protein SAMN05444273_1138 [Litoreibacter ascidiaceicola]|uniref:Sarcosine oxidase subunit gamma n=1 Tax=Litoreibacter ascidiaceicola TaxID=1486859 RepID=A0A1M5EM10_9RHOB|nr:hypothetical protein [Litoreibacter ascidiaceicola]SHF80062.1 hypothetical protein SAMN05444273_1138 [Litoreibacter ascidiaceicola]
MRDDSKKWDAPGAPTTLEMSDGLTITPVQLARQTLLSGVDVLGRTQHPIAAWSGVVTAQTYALSLRRDRVLLVNGPALADGWHGDIAQAVSDVSDCYSVFDIRGDRAFSVLKRGAELRLDVPSKSVARLLFGLGVFLYRFEATDTFRVHVFRGQAETFFKSLKFAFPSL